MRILYAKLVGYVGIYNGLGKTELEIDFTRGKNHICVISGANGCGKSTLLNALNILPDENYNFVPSMNASKHLRIIDCDVVYDINILHPIDGKNNRATTKAYIQKNGVELNENGNVSSYKDIIFNQFDLDNNYITLSHLSGDDRGLADKKPAERKKFIASISSSLDVYNEIHKNLNKKANVYKSYLNNLSGKIKMIGEESNLRSSLISLNNRQKRITDEIEKLKTEIIENNTVIAMNDPNGQLQEKYNSVESSLKELEDKSNKVFTFLRNFYEFNFEIDKLDLEKSKIEAEILEVTKQLELHKQTQQQQNTDIMILTNDIQSINDNISKNDIKINKLNSEINPELDNQIEIYKNNIEEINKEFQQLKIGDIENISSGEINQAIRVLVDFIKGIDVLYEIIDSTSIGRLIEIYKSEYTVNDLINRNNIELENIKEKRNESVNKLLVLNNDLEVLNELDNRPKNCKVDGCYFIQKPMELLKKYGSKKSLINSINKHNKLISDIDEIIRNLNETNENYRHLASGEPILDRLRTLLESNQTIFSKIGIIRRLIDFNDVLGLISNGNLFNEYRNINLLQNASNDIIQYKSIYKTYNNLLSEQKVNQNNIKALNELQKEIEELNNDLNGKIEKRTKIVKELEFLSSIIENLTQKLDSLNKLISYYNDWCDLDNKYQMTKKEFEDLQKQFKGSAVILQQISESKNKIINLQSELDPINDQKKTVDSQLLLLDSYKKEYGEYSEKYEVINTLKKYSSPTAGGIQTLFMSMYMSQTLELANQLLGMIFQGQYRLLDYVINENEFRMPFIGNGLAVDDISSGSTSQVCIMGMIINLTLLNQASTKYNITRLDEIDGGLDPNNRYMFVDILQKIIQILNIEQLFIISHSAESALSNVDVIQLASIKDYEDTFTGANIIYSYKEQ